MFDHEASRAANVGLNPFAGLTTTREPPGDDPVSPHAGVDPEQDAIWHIQRIIAEKLAYIEQCERRLEPWRRRYFDARNRAPAPHAGPVVNASPLWAAYSAAAFSLQGDAADAAARRAEVADNLRKAKAMRDRAVAHPIHQRPCAETLDGC